MRACHRDAAAGRPRSGLHVRDGTAAVAGEDGHPSAASPGVMDRAAYPLDSWFLTIAAASSAAAIAQIVLLRELLVLFHGNEMSMGVALAGWLLWTALGSALAARLWGRIRARTGLVAVLLAVLAAALPALVLAVRGARWVFGIPAGELAPIGKMVLVCLTLPMLFCPVAGTLFGLCWAFRRATDANGAVTQPLSIYLGEALGAAAGGLAFFFVLLEATTAFTAAIVVALILLVVSGCILWSSPRVAGAQPVVLLWSLAVAATLTVTALGGRVEEMSRRWQWGEHPAAYRDTPYHHLTILQQLDQVTVFANGLWLFTRPDPSTTEPAVHIALLAHPLPGRVLLLGGGLAGQVEEALKHPGLEMVEYVELDPELISFSAGFLDDGVRASLSHPRVRIHHQDAGTFLRRDTGCYDVILMSVGDPINAQMNRFYTVEMFRRVRRHLLPGGVFTFAVPGGGDMVGPVHARFLASIARTLEEVFPQVTVLPGERARILAVRDLRPQLVLDPGILADRIGKRQLELAYLREDTLQEAMSPLRIEYLRTILSELEDSPVNRQFSPICYFHTLMLWAAQWHPSLARLLATAAGAKPAYLGSGLVLLGVLATIFFWTGRPRYPTAVAVSVLVQGASGMVIQVVLLLLFQILAGFVYRQLALIIALFMAGLATGTLGIAAAGSWWTTRARTIGWFAASQVGVTAFPLLMLLFVSASGEGLWRSLSSFSASWVISSASLLAGILGGAHFSLAAVASTAAGRPPERTGGYLYALDLSGAAAGALTAGLFLLPLYGVAGTLILFSGLSLICLLAILRGPE